MEFNISSVSVTKEEVEIILGRLSLGEKYEAIAHFLNFLVDEGVAPDSLLMGLTGSVGIVNPKAFEETIKEVCEEK